MKEREMSERMNHSYTMFQELVWAQVEQGMPTAAIVGGTTDWEDLSVALIDTERFMTDGFFDINAWATAIHQTFWDTATQFATFALPVDMVVPHGSEDQHAIVVAGVDRWGYMLSALTTDADENPVGWQLLSNVPPFDTFIQPLRRCVAQRG